MKYRKTGIYKKILATIFAADFFMERALKYIKYVLVIYIASHFTFNGAFIHNHLVEGKTITHSHPFKDVQHSYSSAILLKFFNDAPVLGISAIETSELASPNMVTIETECLQLFYYWNNPDFQLRGPPTA